MKISRNMPRILVALVCCLSVAPVFASGTHTTDWNHTLVLVELAGGNDGLNMVVPYGDPTYYTDRPTIAVPKKSVIPLGREPGSGSHNPLGLNPVMKPLMSSWSAGNLAFVLGVGYPDPNRSHFRSIDIWNTASDSNRYLTTGWIARLFEVDRPPTQLLADSLIIGEDHTGPLEGPGMRNLAMNSIEEFVRSSRLLPAMPARTASSGSGQLAHLRNVETDIRDAAVKLTAVAGAMPTFSTRFPDDPFGRQLELAAQMLASGKNGYVPVVKLTLRGFDTHGSERLVQDHLLAELASGLAAFRSAMIEKGLWNRVLVMTYSEFGRRVAENFSKGTDHGTAEPVLLLGGEVKGGFYGRQPSLTDLDHGDLKFTTDFRTVYTTVGTKFFGIRLSPADMKRVFGRMYDGIPFLKSARTDR